MASGIDGALDDPRATFEEVLDAPLTDYFQRARFALGIASDDSRVVEGRVDLASGTFIWELDGEPFIYNDGVTDYWLADDEDGFEYWDSSEYDPGSLGSFYDFPWPSYNRGGSDWWPDDPVEELDSETLRGTPVRHLRTSGRMEVEGSDGFEQEVDYTVDLWIDALNRPRRVEYVAYIWSEPDQLALEFWDFDGDFTVEAPEGIG